MKKTYLACLLLLTLLSAVGCYDQIESDLNQLERRIEKLEQRCREMNTTLEGLRQIVEKLETYDFLKKVETLYDNGEVVGYTLYFTHSKPVTLYNGTDAETPVLGVGKGEDGVWYWTVKYPSDKQASFLTDNYGVRIPTDAASPEFKIENGYWMVTYDGGEVWHNAGRATGEDGVSFFKSVEDKGEYIQFNLLNGTSILLPTWESFERLQEACRMVNENLDSFTRMAQELDEKVYVNDLIPILDGTDTIGFRICLSNFDSYAFYNGTGTNAPVIGARKATGDPDDDIWYWTIRYADGEPQWILDENGRKIQANAPQGLLPKISLMKDTDDKYYWAIAYGDETPTFLLCDGAKVCVSNDVPDPVVLSVVSVRDDIVSITLDGGQTIQVPMAGTFSVSVSSPVNKGVLAMGARDTVSFNCQLSNADARAEVLPVTRDGFFASAGTTNYKSWKITVISPTGFTKPKTSKLNLLVSNGHGKMKTVVITIEAK